jgi:hypothetical protein
VFNFVSCPINRSTVFLPEQQIPKTQNRKNILAPFGAVEYSRGIYPPDQ